MTGRNPWVVLGVTEDAPYPEIHSAFRRKAKQTHPDGGGDAGEFETVVRAFAVVRRALPPRPRPARPTPYDPWLHSSHPTVSLTDIARPTVHPRSDFASVLLTEISIQRSTSAHGAPAPGAPVA